MPPRLRPLNAARANRTVASLGSRGSACRDRKGSRLCPSAAEHNSSLCRSVSDTHLSCGAGLCVSVLAASTSKLSPSVFLTPRAGAHILLVLKRRCLTRCRLAAKQILGSTLIMFHFLKKKKKASQLKTVLLAQMYSPQNDLHGNMSCKDDAWTLGLRESPAVIWAGCVAGGGTGASPSRRRQCCFWHLLSPSTETQEHCPRSHGWAECQGHHVWPRSDMMTAFTWSP